ncbi:MAG TPA: D-alanine--D-alanine ligase family protein [Gemmatimonadales bacterium]|nr:D-alanine--D-alanine ligase family protein [Gemmatimonadales bacterium]
MGDRPVSSSLAADAGGSKTTGAALAATLTVAVISGGRSSEHDVSLASGVAIGEGLRAAGHEVVPVEIARDGAWRCDGERVSARPGEGLLGVDVAFPALHGPFGEDGTVQGMLETLDVPYVGAGVAASAACMDKVLFKRLLSGTSPAVPQVGYVSVRQARWRTAPEQVLGEVAELGLPVFVKPAHLGSSVGIVKVASPEELDPAIERAFAHDDVVIVEASSSGREVECAVLGELASPAGEISFGGEFYDYEAKYTPGGMQLIVPARIAPDAERRVRELALEVFGAARCHGLARVDFFVEGERVLVNELNTMPGFTPTSVYAKLIDAAGIPYPQLVDRLCRLACERHQRLLALRG